MVASFSSLHNDAALCALTIMERILHKLYFVVPTLALVPFENAFGAVGCFAVRTVENRLVLVNVDDTLAILVGAQLFRGIPLSRIEVVNFSVVLSLSFWKCIEKGCLCIQLLKTVLLRTRNLFIQIYLVLDVAFYTLVTEYVTTGKCPHFILLGNLAFANVANAQFLCYAGKSDNLEDIFVLFKLGLFWIRQIKCIFNVSLLGVNLWIIEYDAWLV